MSRLEVFKNPPFLRFFMQADSRVIKMALFANIKDSKTEFWIKQIVGNLRLETFMAEYVNF